MPSARLEAGTTHSGSGDYFLVEPLLKLRDVNAEVFAEDGTTRNIPDGPVDCANSSLVWPVLTNFFISGAPAAAMSTAVTVHLTINHAVMADLQVGFFYDPNVPAGTGVFLWHGGAGIDLDRDYTEDIFGQDLPPLGQSVNGFYILGVRDCDAGTTGSLEYWSVRVAYDAAPTIDLVADSVVSANSEVAPGDSVSLDWAGHVAGTGSVGTSFLMGFYLSVDATLDGTDTQLGQVVESGVSLPGDTFGGIDQSFTIPGSLADGDYFILLEVDDTDLVDEANEGNNATSRRLSQSPRRPRRLTWLPIAFRHLHPPWNRGGLCR